MAHPGLLTRALQAGAAEVQVVGCPLDDRVNREGSLWLEARLARERAAKLRRAAVGMPIFWYLADARSLRPGTAFPTASVGRT